MLYWSLSVPCTISLLGFHYLHGQVSLLEWTDDLEVFLLKGYGKAINYRMGVPLLQEVVQSMEQAIMAKEGILNSLMLICLLSC